ncbi:GNAT family N-acetyltransferase [Kitasatospora cinereorecta]|uniref:Lysine N-acyltransferase MbtK n=1 Tax=Kitasatospora cinereorecta TaxID=285560 RepID=A0ABW0V8G0_9ACTN
MQGQPAHPAARPGRAGRPGGDPVGLRGDRQPGGGGVTTTFTPVGEFRLVPVSLPADLPLLTTWMNDPAVDAWWELAGPPSVTEEHLRGQLDGDGASTPYLGLLDGEPTGYFEVYRADLDPLAAHYPARPYDMGIHLLLGPATARGRGLGSALLAALAERILATTPACTRVVAEPDLRNTPSVRAFRNAGFAQAAELDLPAKRAALMIRPRARS